MQRAATAENHYDCNMATVVTTGYFTKSATDLAKTNNVELISLGLLQKMFSDYLREGWN
jgi:HJR/Mrr/RecB family endonuclease